MAVVSFTLHQVTSIQTGPLYRVNNTVTAAVGASPAAFVYKTLTQAYDHYATAADMESWPDSLASAQQNGKEFYRLTSVQRDWATVSEMNADLTVTKSRIQLLASDLARLQDGAVIDETVTITAGS